MTQSLHLVRFPAPMNGSIIVGTPSARRRSGGGNRPYSCRYQWQSSVRYQTPARRLADLASLGPKARILLVARTIWIAVLGQSILFLIV